MRTKGTWCGIYGVAGLGLLLAAAGCGGEKKGTTPGRADGSTGTGGRGGSGGSGGSGGAGQGGSAGGVGQGGSAGNVGAGGSAGNVGAGGGGQGGSFDASVPEAEPMDAAPGDMRPVLSMNPPPAPWKAEDVGMVGVPGGSGRNRRNYQVKGSGGDVWAEADAFHFLHRPVTGDVEIVARLAATERTNPDAKAGLMFRETTAVDARNVFMLAFPSATAANGTVTPGKGSRLQYRDKRVDNLTYFTDLTQARDGVVDMPPLWLRLTRRANLFEGFISEDGVNWRKDGEITIALPATISAGLAITAHTNADAALATFESIRVTALTDATWGHAELGTIGGFAGGAPRRFDMVSAGRGIANDEDGITFVHRNVQHLGDVEMTARVTGLTYAGTRPARIGLMLRGMLRGDARMASFLLELGPNGQRYRLQRRAQDGGDISTTEDMTVVRADAGAPADSAATDATADSATDAGAPAATLQPVWIKLVRVGHRFVGFVSDDGRDWRAVIDLPSFVIASNAYLGVTLTSGTEAETVTGRIENVTIGAPATPLPVRPDAGAPDTATGTDAAVDAAVDAATG